MRCSVKGCNERKTPNKQKLTWHRFPNNEKIKDQWINIVGKNNLKIHHKMLCLCSLHFEESAFNRTLNVTRLHDDAVPSGNLLPWARELFLELHTEVDLESDLVKQENDTNSVYNSNSDNASVPGPSNPEDGCITIEKLINKCDQQNKKISCLNQKVRRLSTRLTNYKMIINDLKNKLVNSGYTTDLKECLGPKGTVRNKVPNYKIKIDNLNKNNLANSDCTTVLKIYGGPKDKPRNKVSNYQMKIDDLNKKNLEISTTVLKKSAGLEDFLKENSN